MSGILFLNCKKKSDFSCILLFCKLHPLFLCSIYTCYKPNNIKCVLNPCIYFYVAITIVSFSSSLFQYMLLPKQALIFIINVKIISEHLYIDYIRNSGHVFINFQDLISMYIKLLIKHWSFWDYWKNCSHALFYVARSSCAAIHISSNICFISFKYLV